MSENASLQNRFCEGISKWWPGVEFQGCAMKPRFVCKNYLRDNSDLHRQEIFVRNLNSLRNARHGCEAAALGFTRERFEVLPRERAELSGADDRDRVDSSGATA